MCYLYCPQFLFCAIVLKSSKIQVISSYSEHDIFSLVDTMFHIISVFLQKLIDRSFTCLLNINIRGKCTEGIKSSDDEEFRIFKLKFGLSKATKTGST